MVVCPQASYALCLEVLIKQFFPTEEISTRIHWKKVTFVNSFSFIKTVLLLEWRRRPSGYYDKAAKDK